MACKDNSSDEETDITIYRDVLKSLVPDIELVLQSEIKGVLSQCYAKGLIVDMYERGTTLQPNQQASQLLMMVCAQMSTKPGAYHTFLNILRGNRALEYIPNLIEDKVKQKRKKKRVKRLPKASAKSGVDLEDYSLGFHSEYPSSEMTSLHLDDKDSSDEPDVVSTGGNLSGGSISQGMSNELIPFSGEVVPQEETIEENRELKDSEKIGKPEPEEKSVTCLSNYQQSDSDASLPVFANSGDDGYAVIHRLIEKEKEKADRLRQRLEEVEREKDQDKKKLEEELNKQEADFKHDIEEKNNEIVQLSKRHEETIMDMDKQHQQRIQELKRNLTMERETARQKIEQLEKELQDAKDQNTTLQEEKLELQEEKLELEMKVAELEQKHEKEIKEEKDKYLAELEKMKSEHEKRITELNEGKKLMETKFECDEKMLKMQHKLDLMKKEKERDNEIASLKEEIHRIEKKNADCEAQMKVQQERMKVQQEQMKTERLSHELKKAQSENELLARNRDRSQHSQFIKGVVETGRSLSSGSVITAQFLHLTMKDGEVTSSSQAKLCFTSKNKTEGGVNDGGNQIMDNKGNCDSVCFSMNGDNPEDAAKHTDNLEDTKDVVKCDDTTDLDKTNTGASMDISTVSDQEDNHNIYKI